MSIEGGGGEAAAAATGVRRVPSRSGATGAMHRSSSATRLAQQAEDDPVASRKPLRRLQESPGG